LLLATSACGNVEQSTSLKSCVSACSADADCPDGQTCGDLGMCINAGDTCPCSAGTFMSCDGQNALSCNDQGNGLKTEACGAAGCNETAKGCNACAANTATCSADKTSLEHCGADSTLTQSESCAAGCVTGASGDECGHIKPEWLPDVCNDVAAIPSASLSTSLNTSDDAQCTGGVVTVNGTIFCVVRAKTITIADLRVTGLRPIAFVADDALTVNGILDVSADASAGGPGAGNLGAGVTTLNSSFLGAGGAGFMQIGGTGGGNETGTQSGMSGGAVTQRATTAAFVGGAHGGNSLCGNGSFFCLNNINFSGGGGGGGALLIACRGKVTVSSSALIDAGGGGGAGGGDHSNTSTAITQGGGPGGGSGGYVVFQGASVEITGKLYANGGGGGAGCGTDNCRGLPGSDALRSTSSAPGGAASGNTCGGGAGGSVSQAPANGEQTFASASAGAGGGGGALGRFEVFTPAGVAPVITPVQASPTPVPSTTSLTIE
jgi:hypothetical protein